MAIAPIRPPECRFSFYFLSVASFVVVADVLCDFFVLLLVLGGLLRAAASGRSAAAALALDLLVAAGVLPTVLTSASLSAVAFLSSYSSSFSFSCCRSSTKRCPLPQNRLSRIDRRRIRPFAALWTL